MLAVIRIRHTGGVDGKGCGGCTFVDFGWGESRLPRQALVAIALLSAS